MKSCTQLVILGSVVALIYGAQARAQSNALAAKGDDAKKGTSLLWAFPVPEPNLPGPDHNPKQKQVQGSTKSYTQDQIDDQFNPPDWFPSEHSPAPKAVIKGVPPNLQACGSCHLMSGLGHPESSYLAGLNPRYFLRELADFKSGDRKDPPEYGDSMRAARMNGIMKELSDADAKDAAMWFASLKPAPWYNVVEAKTVPKTFANNARMRFVKPGAGDEPIGNRIIVLPMDQERVEMRDPHSGFNVYVPPGSVNKGKELVTREGRSKTINCAICHGEGLKGLGDIPPLAGQNPLYVVRQLYGFQTGARGGLSAALMKKVVEKLTEDDMLDIAAYLSSLKP